MMCQELSSHICTVLVSTRYFKNWRFFYNMYSKISKNNLKFYPKLQWKKFLNNYSLATKDDVLIQRYLFDYILPISNDIFRSYSLFDSSYSIWKKYIQSFCRTKLITIISNLYLPIWYDIKIFKRVTHRSYTEAAFLSIEWVVNEISCTIRFR